MPLTEHEAHQLAAISQHLGRDDPRLARALATGWCPPRRPRVLYLIVVVATIVALLIGVVAQVPIVCAVAWSALILLTICVGLVD